MNGPLENLIEIIANEEYNERQADHYRDMLQIEMRWAKGETKKIIRAAIMKLEQESIIRGY